MTEKKITKKKIVVLILSLITLGGLLFVSGLANPIIEIEDENLERVIREKLERPTGVIYQTDLRAIHKLDASDRNIESLEGLENFTQLVELNLMNNNIQDLKPLSGLRMLNTLNLNNNNITDLEAVNFGKITNLSLLELDLSNNIEFDTHLSKIALVGKIRTLERLNLSNNWIEDLSPLASLVKLENLNLENNKITSLEKIEFDKITHLPLKNLDLRNNGDDEKFLSDISLIKKIRTLESLNLRDNNIQDVSPLAYLNNLEELDLRNNGLSDLKEANFDQIIHLPLKNLNLRHNVKGQNRISDISLLSEMSTLEELDLRDNHVEDLTPLSNLTNLEILDLRENRFTSIEELENLTKLRELNLRENMIDSIEHLTKLRNLEYLNIHSNKEIKSLDPIGNLLNLETLIMRDIPIGDEFSIFKNLTNLQSVNLLGTGIENIDTVEVVSELRAQGALHGEVRPVTLLHTLEPPLFSHVGGFYEKEFTLELKQDIESGKIYYTLDGSDPTVESFQYKQGETISLKSQNKNEPVLIRAKVINQNKNMSETVTHTYFVEENIHEGFTLPVLSIATNADNLFSKETGIYVGDNALETGRDWERPIHIEFFEKDGMPGFSQDAGIRIHGGWTRKHPHKTFRLYADAEYDNQEVFEHDIFEGLVKKNSNKPKNEFKRLLLRTSGDDRTSTMFRDAMLQTLVAPLNTFDTQAYRPAILFINGEYWGIRNIRERYDEYYLEQTYDVNPEDVAILYADREVNVGETDDVEHYNAMLKYIEENPLNQQSNYEYIQTLMDTENFRDYYIAQTYFGNYDWPFSNIRFWRLKTAKYEKNAPYGHDGRWRWMLFDTDASFGWASHISDLEGNKLDYKHNGIDWVTAESDRRYGDREWGNILFRALIQNESFKNSFINRYADLLNSYFQPKYVINHIDTIKAKIHPEMKNHVQLPESIDSMELWEDEVKDMRTYATERPHYLRQHVMNEFDIKGIVKLTINKEYSKQQSGFIQVNTLEINDDLPGTESNENWTGEYFQGIPITLTAVANPGYEFSHWEGIDVDSMNERIEIIPEIDLSIKPVFREQ